ncbi:DNA binding protein [Arthrobacter phage Atuin]|nr:DNA binding protein [Arthrobacter phage Atuin]
MTETPPCPICHERPSSTETRKDARGRHWCVQCLDEFDSVDWDKYYEEQRGQR